MTFTVLKSNHVPVLNSSRHNDSTLLTQILAVYVLYIIHEINCSPSPCVKTFQLKVWEERF